MFRKLNFMSFKAWLLNGWYYVRFYWMVYLTNHFKNPPVNHANKEGYELVFQDEFDKPEIDWNKWAACEHWGCIRDGNLTVYKPEEVQVENGCAILTSELNTQPEIFTEFESQTPEPPVKCGSLCSWKTFNPTYGFFETREKLPPDGLNNWASFWMYSQRAWPPEIDIFELMGANSSFITMTMHYADWTKNKKEIDEIFSKINMLYKYYPKDVDDAICFLRDPWTQERQSLIDDLVAQRVIQSRSRRLKFPKKDFLAEGFHTYALYWGADKVVWYIDNVAVYILDKHIPDIPFYILITNAAHLTDDGKLPDTLPSKVYCDYFRGYKKL